MAKKRRKLFCEYGPICYEISLFKECKKRDIKEFFAGKRFASKKSKDSLKFIWKGDCKILLRKLEGVDMELQRNKAVNLKIAGGKVDGIIINPGEEFSLWHLVGKPKAKDGYKEGLFISKKGLGKGIGGGLCQLGNLIHWLVLHSPLEVTELHHHTDAIFPDSNRRVPFGTGVSICYNSLDYRFKNTTKYPVQLRIWQDDEMIYGELRSDHELDTKYKIVEEDNHYAKDENGDFYRNSKVYRELYKNKEMIKRELILDNHSRVLYDYSLIPEDQIRK